MGRMQRNKGKRGEREACQEVCEKLWGLQGAHRNQQSRGEWCPDIDPKCPIHIEVKRYKAFSVIKHLEQAEKDSKGEKPEVVLMRQDQDMEWVFMCRASKLEQIANVIFNRTTVTDTSPDRDAPIDRS